MTEIRRKIGYARVSTDEQTLALQIDALKAAGCETIIEDRGISGTAIQRPGLYEALEKLQAGDLLMVWKLDRLSRSIFHLIELMNDLKARGVGFASISDQIETTTPGGRLYFHIMGALAEFERDLIVERTKAGMKAAKRRGKHIGRPQALNAGQLDHAKTLRGQGASYAEIAALFKVDRKTVSKLLNEKTA